MPQFKRPKIRLILPESDSGKPPMPTPIDNAIARNKGASVVIEATKESLQASKDTATPSLSEIIAEKTRENDRLRQELAYLQRKQALDMFLLQGATSAKETLEGTTAEYQRLLAIVTDEHGVPP